MNNKQRSADVNPFRTSRIESLKWNNYIISIDELFNKWEKNHFRGQIVGDHGSGKTTAALILKDYLENKGLNCKYLFANIDSRKDNFLEWDQQVNTQGENTFFIFDGIGHANFLKRRKWLANATKYLCLVHKPLKSIPVLAEFKVDEELLCTLTEELAGEVYKDILQKAGGAKALLDKHRNNLRECFFELYKVWKDL